MEIITGYTGRPHVTAEQDRDINQGIVGAESYVLLTGMQLAAELASNNEVKIRDGVIMHQGCAASIKKDTYDSMTIANGSQGMKRVDRIVARYTKNPDSGVEAVNLIVLQGTPSELNPEAPDYTEGDIRGGAAVADMPLYRVTIDGLNITEVEKEFVAMQSCESLAAGLDRITIEEYVIKDVTIPKASYNNAFCTVKSKAGYSQAIPLFVKFKNSANGGKQESSSNCYRIAFGTESGEDADDNVYVFLRNVSTAYDAKVDVYFCIIYVR